MHQLMQHPYVLTAITVIGTWLFNNVVTVMVTALPAPTKDSSKLYTYWFSVVNGVMGNIKRAENTHVEDSPNWQDAVEKYVKTRIADGTLTEVKK